MLDRRPIVRTLDDLGRGMDVALRIQNVNAILLHLDAYPLPMEAGFVCRGADTYRRKNRGSGFTQEVIHLADKFFSPVRLGHEPAAIGDFRAARRLLPGSNYKNLWPPSVNLPS